MRKKYSGIPLIHGSDPSLASKLDRGRDQGMKECIRRITARDSISAAVGIFSLMSVRGTAYSVERRSSGVPSDFGASTLGSDLAGSRLALSTCGVSTRAATS